MTVPTRMDEDLLNYFNSLQGREDIGDKDVQQLIDAYRTKFQIENLFTTADCGMMRHTVDGSRILSINRAALDILGYDSEEELLAEGFDMIASTVLEEDKSMLRAVIKQLKKAGDSVSVDYRILHRDGSIINVTGDIKLLEENGELIYQRFLFDRTAQRKQEEQQYQEEKRWQTEMIQALSIDFSSVYFVDLDRGTCVPYRMNDDITRRYGSVFVGTIPFEESIGLYINDVVYQPDQEMLREASSISSLLKELSGKSSYYMNYRTMRSGTVEYFQMKAVRGGDWEKERRIVLGFRSVDEEIRSEMIQKKKLEDSYEIIAGLCSDYNFISLINSENGRMSVYKANDDSPEVVHALANRDNYYEAISAYADYVYEEDKEFWFAATRLEHIWEQLQNKKIYNVNVRHKSHGKMEYIQFSFTRVSDRGNGFQLVLGKRIITDVVEKEMRQRMLVEDALAQAEQANQAKSTFLSNMSHDIRTPMNAIIGFTALATTHIDNKERVLEYLGKIMSSGNHLLSLINDVLDMSRIESGKIRIEEKPCSLPEILHELRNILQADMKAKQLELYIDTVDVLNEEIYCDRLRLNQVFLNLLSNAVKFTGVGGTITMRIIEKPNAPAGFGNYEFHIKDTGIGMSKEFMAHIFEPFERERSSTISGIQGTGLGMAITKNIIDMMDGHIEVHSEQGRGTEFIVSLTFRLQSSPVVPQIIPELQGCRALVVDDDFNTCDSVTSMLAQIGMRAEWTMSGREAVLRTRQAISRGDEYFAYIVDWLIPDMNGIEVVRRIRSEISENVPIIVLTAYDWSDVEDEAKEAGVTAFCSKPLFLSELRQCLAEITDPGYNRNTEEKAPLRSGRILLVEDNVLNQEIAVELLAEKGFQIETAENGQMAVSMVKDSKPGYYQLVLMDVQMPVMNGYDATRAIRNLEDEALASVPILAMTANAFEEDRQMALESGMNGHISKPIDIDNLLAALDEMLK